MRNPWFTIIGVSVGLQLTNHVYVSNSITYFLHERFPSLALGPQSLESIGASQSRSSQTPEIGSLESLDLLCIIFGDNHIAYIDDQTCH